VSSPVAVYRRQAEELRPAKWLALLGNLGSAATLERHLSEGVVTRLGAHGQCIYNTLNGRHLCPERRTYEHE
jgi:hypothetical protein